MALTEQQYDFISRTLGVWVGIPEPEAFECALLRMAQVVARVETLLGELELRAAEHDALRHAARERLEGMAE